MLFRLCSSVRFPVCSAFAFDCDRATFDVAVVVVSLFSSSLGSFIGIPSAFVFIAMSEWVCACLYWLVGYLGSDEKEEDWLTWLFFIFVDCAVVVVVVEMASKDQTWSDITYLIALSLFSFCHKSASRYLYVSYRCCRFYATFVLSHLVFSLSLFLYINIYRYFLVFSRWASVEVCAMVEAAWAWVRVFHLYCMCHSNLTFLFRKRERERECLIRNY